MSGAKTAFLAKLIVEEIARDFADNPGMDVEDAVYTTVFDRVSETITADKDVIAFIGEIDLNAAPDGDTLFRAIQKAVEEAVRADVSLLIDSDPRFQVDKAPRP